MTTREKLMRAVLDLPEEELDGALEYVASRGREDDVDEWGSLSKWGELQFTDTMRRLAEEERAAYDRRPVVPVV